MGSLAGIIFVEYVWCAQALTARALATQLRAAASSDLLAKVKPEKVKARKTPGSRVPDVVNVCHFCRAEKHKVSWKYRSPSGKTLLNGGTFYACTQAARFLNFTRSHEKIKAAGAVSMVLEVSRLERKQLQKLAKDKCACFECKPKVEA